ncbi:hypothetical protein B296_00043970 [Ensete ventricosum]|uniref:Uncharacterized protein n=1 Tax=Ensete ventricosum TaxID=4639 RepID=A0A426Z6K4_ENSVE|nr:hypothetical protein B296_00043970 [Ensete ventricosum]
MSAFGSSLSVMDITAEVAMAYKFRGIGGGLGNGSLGLSILFLRGPKDYPQACLERGHFKSSRFLATRIWSNLVLFLGAAVHAVVHCFELKSGDRRQLQEDHHEQRWKKLPSAPTRASESTQARTQAFIKRESVDDPPCAESAQSTDTVISLFFPQHSELL